MSKKTLAYIAIWVTTLIWGFGYLGVEDAINGGWGTFPLIFARFGIAGLCLLPISIKHKWWKNLPLMKDAFINAIGSENDIRNVNYIIWKYAFEPSGFIWGGNWSSRSFDPMHYEVE